MKYAAFALIALLASSAAPAKAAPIDGMRYLVGSWTCTYRAGAMNFVYHARYAYDSQSRAMREIASWTGGGDEELLGYDPQRGGWTAIVLDDHGNATIMRGTGSDPRHVRYRSVYPDASIAERVDRLSPNRYTIHATVRSGGKTIESVDTCSRS